MLHSGRKEYAGTETITQGMEMNITAIILTHFQLSLLMFQLILKLNFSKHGLFFPPVSVCFEYFVFHCAIRSVDKSDNTSKLYRMH